MARINSGKYRHLVTFQRLKEAQNLYGETSVNVDENWEDTFTVRAGIFPISGREFMSLQEVKEAEISHRVVLRFMEGIDSTMRIKFGTRIFEIISPPINGQERNEELVLFVKEREVKPTSIPVPPPTEPIASPPTPLNLRVERLYSGTYRLTWELSGLTPPDFTRFLIVVNDVYTIYITDGQVREYLIHGLNESVFNYIYMATETTLLYYSQAVEIYP